MKRICLFHKTWKAKQSTDFARDCDLDALSSLALGHLFLYYILENVLMSRPNKNITPSTCCALIRRINDWHPISLWKVKLYHLITTKSVLSFIGITMWLWPLVALKSNINTFSPPACHITTFKWVYLNIGDIRLLCVLKTAWVSAALVLRGSPSAVQGCSIVFADILSASKHSVKQHLWHSVSMCTVWHWESIFFQLTVQTDLRRSKLQSFFFCFKWLLLRVEGCTSSAAHSAHSELLALQREQEKKKECVLGCYKTLIVPSFHKLTSESLRGGSVI